MIEYSINQRFKELIEQIELTSQMNGEISPRGLKVKEALLTIFSINPNFPCIDFKSRNFNYKYFAAEVAWYLLKSNDITFISKFSNFWNNITNPDGKTINSNYGRLLFTKNPETGTSQIAWAVNSLRKDKNSRQAIAYLGNPSFQFEGNKDFVCTQYINFFIRDNKLHMKVQMRSNDIFYGLSYDAPWFSLVHQNTYLELKEQYPELQLGQYFHFSDNSHFYERHFDLAKNILDEEVTLGPKIILENPLWHTYDDGSCVLSSSAGKYLEFFNSNMNDITEFNTNQYKEVLRKIIRIS